MIKKNDKSCLIIPMAILMALLNTACTTNDDTSFTQTDTISANEEIVSVMSYGFVDLEGAKTSAIILEYKDEILASSLDLEDYEVMDYAIFEENNTSFDEAIEVDGDNEAGNEGQPVKVYVNSEPEISDTNGVEYGKYVIIEINTDYMLSGQNLVYTSSMMASAKQVGEVSTEDKCVLASDTEFSNYTVEEVTYTNDWGEHNETVITTDKESIILPEFNEDSGWTLNYIGEGAFSAKDCYSEYTGEYVDFELPYSIYVPSQEVLEENKGNIAVVVHMEHAGSNDTDPMAAITSSKAAVKLSSSEVQEDNPAIVIVPQIEESRRSTNDYDASSEANTAVWELLDYILDEYKDYVNTDRIYGTGQSMGGMTILNMAAQRDNFFAGIAVIGAQWSNSYNKEFQNNGSPARTPENDPISFNGFGLDSENYQNWYYMVSDDNIMVHTCAEDPMATGEWKALADYFEAAGTQIAYDEWSPYITLEEQYEKDKALAEQASMEAGDGIIWGAFNSGGHMQTWKYGYQLTYPFEWLFSQSRQTEVEREKLTQLNNEWLGRDEDNKVIFGSGTAGLNSAQFTPGGASEIYTEGWTPVYATNALINILPDEITEENIRDVKSAYTAYNLLTDKEKSQIENTDKLLNAVDELSLAN
ncbi:MAG: hypothetical protein K6D38_09570 [Pseudobutyrivibrio sp.]|nr:hypothetical protein [Pseudobutyrivibrio sp.]